MGTCGLITARPAAIFTKNLQSEKFWGHSRKLPYNRAHRCYRNDRQPTPSPSALSLLPTALQNRPSDIQAFASETFSDPNLKEQVQQVNLRSDRRQPHGCNSCSVAGFWSASTVVVWMKVSQSVCNDSTVRRTFLRRSREGYRLLLRLLTFLRTWQAMARNGGRFGHDQQLHEAAGASARRARQDDGKKRRNPKDNSSRDRSSREKSPKGKASSSGKTTSRAKTC